MSKTVSITCRTADAIIRYTTDGTGITEQSPIYSSPFSAEYGTIIMAKGFKDGLAPSDVASLKVGALTVTDPSQILYAALTDGVVFYDRGEEYGDYNLTDGVLTRISAGVDDETAESINWRYLIAQTEDLFAYSEGIVWSTVLVSTGLKDHNYGAGLPNTNSLISMYSNNSDLIWSHVKNERLTTGKNWFIPSGSELGGMINNRDKISSENTWNGNYYASSTEASSTDCACKDANGTSYNIDKNRVNYFNWRLIRRI